MKRIFLFLMACSISYSSLIAQEKNQAGTVTIQGEVTKPLTLDYAQLTKMKPATVTLKDRDGNNHLYTGVPVIDLLNRAGVTTGKQLHGKHLTKYVIVKCADGYEVLFSLAELDTAYTSKMVVLAYETEGKALPDGKGPLRLVMPGESRPARSCFQVTELVVRFAKD